MRERAIFATAVTALLLLCNAGWVLAKTVNCTQVDLPNVVATLVSGYSIYVDCLPRFGKSSPATIVLDDIDGDAIPELRVESGDAEVSWWNLDGSPYSYRDSGKPHGESPSSLSAQIAPATPGLPEVQPGWPTDVTGEIYSSPAFGNLVGDGRLEVVIGCDDNLVYAFDADGNALPGWPKITDGDVLSSPALGDIDDDGEPEVVVGSWDHYVYAWNADGTTVQGAWPIFTDGVVVSSPALGDVDNDGKVEIVIASYYGYTSTLYVLNGDGSNCTGWPVYIDQSIDCTPALADIDDDGRIEIVVGSRKLSEGRVYAFNGEDGTIVDGWPVSTQGSIQLCSPVVGDIDSDGDLEIVVGTSYWGGFVYVFENDGTIADGWPKDVSNNVTASPALADFNGDGNLEILVGTNIYLGSPLLGRLYMWYFDGEVAPSWPVVFDGYEQRVTASPVIADIDFDGSLDVIIGTSSDEVEPFPGLYAYSCYATIVNSFWPTLEGNIRSTSALADIDWDGELELVVGSGYEHKV